MPCGCRPVRTPVEVLDGLVAGVLGGEGWGATFLGPLALLLGMIGMLVTTILLFMRSTLLYLVAAFAPLVWSSSILPMMRGGVRRMVHLAVALVLAKPAIVISLAIGMQLIASAGDVGEDSGNVAGIGAMLTGFFCFAVASISPWVVYKLLPAAEGAAVASGVVGGWARGGDDRGPGRDDGQVDGRGQGGQRSDQGDPRRRRWKAAARVLATLVRRWRRRRWRRRRSAGRSGAAGGVELRWRVRRRRVARRRPVRPLVRRHRSRSASPLRRRQRRRRRAAASTCVDTGVVGVDCVDGCRRLAAPPAGSGAAAARRSAGSGGDARQAAPRRVVISSSRLGGRGDDDGDGSES